MSLLSLKSCCSLLIIWPWLCYGGGIHELVRTGDRSKPRSVQDLKEYLQKHPESVNSKDDNSGATPLMLAANEGCVPMVELLLAKGADANGVGKDGFSILQSAVSRRAQQWPSPYGQQQYAKVAELLDAHGAEFDIFSAAGLNNVRRVATLLDNNSQLLNARDPRSFTPLHWAAEQNAVEVIELLVRRGASVDTKAEIRSGVTPLCVAASLDQASAAGVLLRSGADVNLAAGGMDDPPLIWAMGTGRREVMKLLLEHGANVDQRRKGGDTALHFAAWNGNKFTIELLLSYKANVNATNNFGGTPLHAAAGLGKQTAVEALLSHGSEINAKDKQGNTALSLATQHGHKQVIEFLRQHGATE